jgi:hypothetical protein
MQSLSTLLSIFLATALASPVAVPPIKSKATTSSPSSIVIHIDAFTESSTNGQIQEVSFHATSKDPVLLDLSCKTKALNTTDTTFEYNRIYKCGNGGTMSFSYADGEGPREPNHLKLWLSSNHKSFSGGTVVEGTQKDAFSLNLNPVGL